MKYLFTRCNGKRTVLIAPQEILDEISTNPKFEITKKQLENHLQNLVLDGYLDYSHSDNKGELFYVVALTTRGEAFKREHEERVKRRWKEIGWRVLLAVICSVVAYVLGRLL